MDKEPKTKQELETALTETRDEISRVEAEIARDEAELAARGLNPDGTSIGKEKKPASSKRSIWPLIAAGTASLGAAAFGFNKVVKDGQNEVQRLASTRPEKIETTDRPRITPPPRAPYAAPATPLPDPSTLKFDAAFPSSDTGPLSSPSSASPEASTPAMLEADGEPRTPEEIEDMKRRLADREAHDLKEIEMMKAAEARAKALKDQIIAQIDKAPGQKTKKPSMRMPGSNIRLVETPAPEKPTVIRQSPYSYYASGPAADPVTLSTNPAYGPKPEISKEVKDPVTNPYFLSAAERAKADELFTEKIEILFPVDTLSVWTKIKNKNAYEYLSTTEGKKLKNMLGLPPGGIKSKMTMEQFLENIAQKEIADAR